MVPLMVVAAMVISYELKAELLLFNLSRHEIEIPDSQLALHRGILFSDRETEVEVILREDKEV